MGVVYLAGPIDDLPIGQARAWRQCISATLVAMGHIGYDPSRPWLWAGQEPDLMKQAAHIDQINRAVIRLSAAVIANLAGPGRGLGTIREIEFARSQGKPVLVVIPNDLPPTVALHDVFTMRVASVEAFWADEGAIGDMLQEFTDWQMDGSFLQTGAWTERPSGGLR